MTSKLSFYLKAARLHTLPLSLAGVILGSMLATTEGLFDTKIFVFAILTTISYQVLSNYANDYGDGIKGTDNEERIGPKRMWESGVIGKKGWKKLLITSTVISLLLSLALLYIAFGTEYLRYFILFILLGIASVAAAILYTVGNYAYGYRGLGDLFVFLFFGLLSVTGSYFLYTKHINWTIFLPATSIGLLSTGVLHLNNMRDRLTDEKSGKNTLAVRFGVAGSKKYYYYLIGFSLIFALFYSNYHYRSPWQYIYIAGYIPVIRQLIRVLRNDKPEKLYPELKILALSTFIIAVLFGLGEIIAAN